MSQIYHRTNYHCRHCERDAHIMAMVAVSAEEKNIDVYEEEHNCSNVILQRFKIAVGGFKSIVSE